MLTYVLRRLLLMLPVAFLVTVGVFMLIHLTPGDPAYLLLQAPGRQTITPQDLHSSGPSSTSTTRCRCAT